MPSPHSPIWQARFLALAHHCANWSKDPSTQVGAVVVGQTRNLVAFGYNGFPPGIADSPERLAERQVKYALVRHAEVNAISNAGFAPVYLYSTHFPCIRCAVDIVAAGTIRHVIAPLPVEYAERWREDVARAQALFQEAGITTGVPHGNP